MEMPETAVDQNRDPVFRKNDIRSAIQASRRVNEHRDAVARLRAQGLSGRAIAKELGTSNSNVFRLIADLEKAA